MISSFIGAMVAWFFFHSKNSIGVGMLLGLFGGGVVGFRILRKDLKTPEGGEYCKCIDEA